MRVIRSIFFYLILFFSTIVMGSLATAGSFIHRKWPNRVARVWGNLNLWAAGVKVTLNGVENINSPGPYIFASNHQGWFDIFAALGKVPFYFSWLAKEELFKLPVLGRAMHSAGYIPINRSDRRQAMNSLNRAASIIREGTSVFIFPEGTRSMDGILREFKKGGFVLALKSQQPIVPVSISGSYRIMTKGSWLINPGEIRISIGRPIPTGGSDGKSRDELMERVREAIRGNLSVEEAGSDSAAAKPRQSASSPGSTTNGNV